MSMETHPTSPESPPHDAQSTATLRSAASLSGTNSAFASIDRAANEAIQPSSTSNGRSIGHDLAAIVVEGTLVPSDQASGDAGNDADDKSVSSQHVRKRHKISSLFQSSRSEGKVRAPRRYLVTSQLSAPSTVETLSMKFLVLPTPSMQSSAALTLNTQSTPLMSIGLHPIQPSALPVNSHVAVFSQNVNLTGILGTLPEFGSRIDTTPQLALCIGLIPENSDPSNHSSQDLSSGTAAQLAWIKSMRQDSVEQERLRWLGARMVDEFAKGASKTSTEIAEMVLIGPVLDNENYRRLLSYTIKAFDQAVLLDVDLLQGLVQLVQSAPSEALLPDDLVKILRILRVRLQDTHQQSSVHPFHLTLAVSRLLDVMAEHKVKDLDRVDEHEPLSGVLSGLKASADPYLMYQACYA
ncbi:hypothetical protein BGZ89_003453, partial [Linnemannia elongata]